jgi:1-phosphofructokinase family hexose kinase
MIAVIGPNPAVDVLLEVPNFEPGGTSRSRSTRRLAGGKPLNVARTLRRMGVPALLCLPLERGGEGRDLISDACRDLGIDLRAITVEARVRSAYVITSAGSATVINEPGGPLTADEAATFESLCRRALNEGSLAAGCGSLPEGLPDDFYARLGAGTRLIVDTSGPALRAAIEAGVWAIKVNSEEIAAATGIEDPRGAARAARESGVDHVVVTLGAEGALYLGPDGDCRVSAPSVQTVNPTGAGDALLAGLLSALEHGTGWHQGLRQGTAVAALCASLPGPDVGSSPEIAPLAAAVTIDSL